MRHHDHLKTVYMSGLRCCIAQVKQGCCILQNACVLEHMEIQPRVAAGMFPIQDHGVERAVPEVCRWAQLTSERFGAAEATANCGKNLAGECSNKVWHRSSADAVS